MPSRTKQPLSFAPRIAGRSRRARSRRHTLSTLGRDVLAFETLEARHLLTTVGDFNADNRVDVADVDALAVQINRGPAADLAFDLTGDAQVDALDLANLIESVLATNFGDANLDGVVDRADAASLASNLGRTGAPSWAHGNFDANDTVDLADIGVLQPRLGFTGPSDPQIVNTTTVLNQSLPTIETALFDWAALFDLTITAGPSPAGSGPAAGNLSENVPVVDDDFFGTLGVSAALGDAVPEVEITGNDLQLRARLAEAGYSIDLFPGGPEGGVDNEVLQVRFAGRVEGLVGQTPLDAATIGLLNDLNPAATLDGTIDYGTVDHPAAIDLELVFGVDDVGFYLLGESQITLEVGAEGDLVGSFPLPIESLDSVLAAHAAVDAVVALTQSDPARRLRTADLSAPASSIWNVSVDADAEVTLATSLNHDGQPTPFSVGSSWQIPMVDGVLGTVTSSFDAPDADAFVDALFPIFEDGLSSFLSPEIAALVDEFPLPFGDDSGPFPFVDDQTAQEGQPSGALARFFEYVVSRFQTTFDHTGQGIAYTIGDLLQRTDQLRAESLATGAGVRIGVISDGDRGLADAQANGELPANLTVNPNLASAGAEGTAMLEIVHDIAPGAELFFSGTGATVASSTTAHGRFIEAVNWLVSQGVQVIVDDKFLGAEPFYADGPVAQHVQSLIDNPPDHDNNALTPPLEILFVTAAGNFAQRHMRGVFDVAEHTFADGSKRNLHFFEGIDPFLTFQSNPSPAGAQHWLALNWNVPYNTTQTPMFRLLLVDGTNNLPLTIAAEDLSSAQSILRFTQSKAIAATLAIEYIGANPAPTGLEFSLLASESIPPEGTQVFGALGDPSDSIWGHAALLDVLTVGAVNVDDPSQVASYSAHGPATINGEATPRNVLDLVAGDNVQVSGAGGFPVPFRGTSAAAPHVAALAALLTQLYPDAGPNDLRDAIASSATDIGTSGYDQQSGRGLADAIAADITLDATFDRAVLAAPSPAAGEPAASPIDFSGGSLLDALGFDLDHAISPQNIQDFLRGEPLSEDLARVSITLDAGDDFEPVAVSYALDLADVGALEQFGLQGAIAAEVTPNLSLSFGIDADGFFLDSASTAGGLISGTVDASAESLGPFGVEVRGGLTAEPSIGFAALGAGRLRIDDVAGALGALQVSLGTVTAELDAALISRFLDYVPVDAIAENNSPRGGDPFRFVARTSLEATSTAGGISYTFSGIDLLNPDVDEDGTPDFTMPVLVDNLIQFGRDQVVSPDGLFGPHSVLTTFLGDESIPLSGNSVQDNVSLDTAAPDFDADGNLSAIADLADWVADNYELLDVVEFDTIEDWLENGFPGGTEELMRLRLDLDGVELTFIEDLQGQLGDLLPSGIDPTDLVKIQNVELSGQLVFGVDTSSTGFFLVVQDEQGNPDDATRVGVSLDLIGNLSGATMSNGFFSFDDASIRVSPEIGFLLGGGDGTKLRVDDLTSGNFTVGVTLDDGEIFLGATGATLFPDKASTAFQGSIDGIGGTVGLDGSTNLEALRVALRIGEAVEVTAGGVLFAFDPANPSGTVASLNNASVRFPTLPDFPRGSIDQLVITPTMIDLQGLTVFGGGSQGASPTSMSLDLQSGELAGASPQAGDQTTAAKTAQPILSGVFDLAVIAKAGDAVVRKNAAGTITEARSIASIAPGFSVNNLGQIVYSAADSTGSSIYTTTAGRASTWISDEIPDESTFTFGPDVAINDQGQVLFHATSAGVQSVRLFDPTKELDEPTERLRTLALTGTGGDYQSIQSGLALTNLKTGASVDDELFAVFVATNSSNQQQLVEDDVESGFPDLVDREDINGALHPDVTMTGQVLVRAESAGGGELRFYRGNDLDDLDATLRDRSNQWFDGIGEQPAVSDDGRVIVFLGVLNATGATSLGSTVGPAIFAAVDDGADGRTIARLFGAADAPGIGALLSLSETQIDVNTLGVGTDDYLLALTAQDTNGQTAIFAARLNQAAAGSASYTSTTPAKVAVVGGTLPALVGETVVELRLGDSVSSNGQIIFWAKTTNLDGVIVRAKEPVRPLVLVPGVAGTFAAPGVSLSDWLLTRGVPPDQLAIDPLAGAYDNLIESLERAGYIQGLDLYVANYDWRLDPGPLDGGIPGPSYDDATIDGHITGLTAGTADPANPARKFSITDATYEYGVDYLGYWLRKVAEDWYARFGVALDGDGVDVMMHSTGGLVGRVYLQSDAYGGQFSTDIAGQPVTLNLPRFHDFIMAGVPNRGATKAWNPLHNNFNSDPAFQYVLSKILFMAGNLVDRKGMTITGPFGQTIGPADIDLTDEASIRAFILDYLPTARSLLATYPFIVPEGASFTAEQIRIKANFDHRLVHVGEDGFESHLRNNLLLDLNNGLDLDGLASPVPELHNRFLDGLTGSAFALQGTEKISTKEDLITDAETVVLTTAKRGDELGGDDIAGIENFGRDANSGELWYKDFRVANGGDGTVPHMSFVGQFLGDSRVERQQFPDSHLGMLSTTQLQEFVLEKLGRPVATSVVSTLETGVNKRVLSPILLASEAAIGEEIGSLVRGSVLDENLRAMVTDPLRDAFFVDGLGRRTGYSEAEGVVVEIPGSAYFGDANGLAYIGTEVVEPLTVQIVGGGEDFLVRAEGGSNTQGGLSLSGLLADGAAQIHDLDLIELFRGWGVTGLFEVVNPMLTLNLTVDYGGPMIEVSGDLTVAADHVAIFPDDTTETDPADVAGTLDGLITASGLTGTIDLATGEFHAEVATANLDVDGVLTATAASIPNPNLGEPGNTDLRPVLPALEINFPPDDTMPGAVIGAVRGLTVDFEALGDDVPSDLISINQAILRRNGFSLDGSIGDPAAVISLGGSDPIVRLTGLVGTADVDVTFTPQFGVTGTVGIEATTAEFLPGSEINGTLVGAELTVDLATGASLVTVDELNFEVGDLFTVSAVSEDGQPAIELDLTSVLTDPTATIVTIPSATISTGLFTDAANQPISFELTDLVVRGDGVALGSATLLPTDLFLSLGGVDVVEFVGLSASINDLSFDRTNGFGATGLTLSVAEAALLPDRATSEVDGVATLTGLQVDFDLTTGDLNVSATSMDATLGDFIEISVRASDGDDPVELALTSDTTQPMLHLPIVEASFIGLADVANIPRDQSPKLQITDLDFYADGNWQLSSVGLLDAASFVFGVADFLPFALDTAVLSNFGQTAGGGVDFNQFTLDVTAKVNWQSSLFQSLPFDPYVVVGGVRVDEQTDNALPLTIVVDDLSQGKLSFANTGAITIGLENWDVGGIVFEGELSFGQYNGMGALEPIAPGGPQLAGYIGFNTAQSDVDPFAAGEADFDRFEDTSSPEDAASQHAIDDANSGGDLLDVSVEGGRIAIAGAVTNDGNLLSAEFTVDASIDLRFKLAEIFELYGVSFDFTFVVATPVATFAPTFEVTSATLAVDALRLSFGGSDPDKSLEFTALGYTTSTNEYIPAVRINVVPEDDEPLAEFGTLGVHFPDIFIVGGSGTDRIGGRISGLRLLQGFIPDVRDDLEIVGDFGDFFSPENEIFSWLPFRVDSLGVRFQDGFFERDPQTTAIIGIDDPVAFDLAFSGGFVDVELVDGVRFPIEATVDNLEVDVAKLKRFVTDPNVIPDLANFPIKNLDGISIGLDPFSFFEDSPISFRGKLSLGEINQDGIRAIYGRVLGEFAYSDWGGGIDLIISDRGPLLAKVNVPLAIVLGQTTLTISGVSGGIAFGIGNLRSVDDPLDLVRDPVFIDPFDVSTEGIKDALRGILDKEAELGHPVFTWSESFTIGLSGTITSVAVAGAISGEVTLVANVEWPDVQIGPGGEINQPITDFIPDLRLFGTGNIAIFGMPIGRAGLLLDYSDPLSPSLAFGFAAPAPGSPLGFLIPAQAELGALLTTDGFYEAPIVALSSFVASMAGSTLDAISARLEADHTRPLSTLLLDLDADGELSAAEDAQVIASSFILDRLLNGVDDPVNVGQTVPSLLPTSFGEVVNFDMAVASRVTNAFTTEYFNVVGDVAGMAEAIRCESLPTVPQECVGVPNVASYFVAGQQAVADFAGAIAAAAFQAGLDAWEGFDPRLTISGRIQPTILGFPIGTPLIDGTITLEKSGLTVQLGTRLTKILELIVNQASGGIGGTLLSLLSLGMEDFTQVGYRLEFPEEELITIVRGLLTGGAAILDPSDPTGNTELVPATDLIQAMINLVNPFAGWEALISSEFTIAGFRVGNVSGVMFDKLDADQFDPTTGEPLPDPVTLAGSRIYNLDDDRDGEPDPARVSISDNDPQLIPVPTYGQYLDIFQKGGLLLTGELLLPAVLRDPVRVISSIDWQPPQNTTVVPPRPYQASDFTSDPFLAFSAFGEYQTWIGDIVTALTNIESYGRIQMFVPSLSSLFTLGDYLEPYGADESADGVVEQIVDPAAANLVVVTPEEEAFLDNNTNSTFDIGIDTALLFAPPEPCYDSFVDTAGVDECTPGDGFVDVNLNNRYDAGVDTLVDLDGTAGASEEMFVDLDGDGAYFAGGWFEDLGNGLYDDGEQYVDVGNGVYDFGEAFVDNDGNGIYEAGTSDTFTDAGNGVYDGPEPFDDVNQDGVFDPATETFTDTNGNEQYDAGEAFLDIGNGVFDGANGLAERVTFVDPTNVQTIIQGIIDSFYIEGYLDVDLLSINFGKGFLRIDANGLEAEVDIPWLLGAKATAGIGFRSMSFTETLTEMMESPLVASVIDGLPIGVSAEEIRDSLLPSSGLPIPDIRVAFPVGFLSGELDYDGLRAWIQTVLDVPANVIDVPELPPADETAFRASFDIFTPGYGDAAAGASATEVYGGFRLNAMLNLPAVVENLDFTFEMTLPAIDPLNPPPLSNVVSLLIPNFTATARASRIELGAGLGGVDTLVRLEGIGGQDAIVSLSKADINGTPTLSGTINGQLTLLDSLSLTALGDFEADLSLTDPAIFGDIALGVGQLSPVSDYTFDADFHLQFNSDLQGDDREIMRGGQPLSIPAGLRVFADGSIDVLGSSLVGDFSLTVDPTPGAQKIELDASFALQATVGGVDLIDVSGSGGMTLDGAGVAAAIDVTLATGPAAALGFGLTGGSVRLEANTTREERDVGGVTLPRNPTDPAAPGVPYIRAEFENVAVAANGFSLSGDLSFLLAPTVVEISGTVDSIDLGPLGQYSGTAALQITSAGVAGTFAVSAAGMPNPVFDFSGAFSMEVNTTGSLALGIPANTVRLAVSDAALRFLDRDPGPAFDPQFELGPFAAAVSYSAAESRFEMSFSGDVSMWGIGDVAFSGLVASDGLFDISGSVDVDIVFPEDPPTAFEFHHDAAIDITRSGQFDPIAFDANFSASSPTVFGFPVLPNSSAGVTSAGCMTVAMSYESPKSIYEPLVIVTRSVSVYVDLNRSIFEQNIFSPANLDPQLCGGGDPAPLDIALIDVASANHGDGIVFVEADPVEGNLLVRQIEAPEGDEVLLTATGLPAGATVDVLVSLVSETLAAINTPVDGEDYQNLQLGVITLTGVDANGDGEGDPLSITLAEILSDGQFEFHESFTLDLEIVDGSASGVDFVLLATDRLRYTIVNTTPEAAGSVAYYDFDAPITGAYTPSPTFVVDEEHLAASPLRHGPEAFVFTRSMSFNFVDEDNDYIEVQMNDPLPRDAISFEFWMRPDASTTTFEHPIGLGGENQATVYIRSDTNKIVLKFQSINGLRVERTIGDYVVGQWYHVAVTYDGSQVKGYLNGEVTTVGNASGLINYLGGFEDLVYFGTFDTVTDKAYDGRLDDVRIWDRALSAAEVSLNKDRMLSGTESGLIGYWRFDETSGTIAIDSTGNGQDGEFGPASPQNRQPGRSSIVAPVSFPPTDAPGVFEGVPEIQPDTSPPEPISQVAAADTWQRGNSPYRMHLRMDETSGTNLADATNTNHSGFLLGGAYTTGAFGGGVALDGVNDYVRIFNTTDLPGTGGNFTVTFALKLDDWDNTNGIVAAYNANGIGFIIGPSATDDAMVVRTSFGSGSGTTYEASLAGLIDGEFAHFAVSFLSTLGVTGFYINGQPVADSGDDAWALGDANFFSLGRRIRSGSSSQYLDGVIDDFSIFGGTFSQGYAQTVASGGALAHAVDWTANVYEFSVALNDGGPIAPVDVRLTLTDLRFYDHADAGGVTEWLLKSSLDNFRTLIDSGAAHVGEYDRSLAEFGPEYSCLRPSDTPITFRLYGVANADQTWRVDNLSLLGAIHDSDACIDPPVAIDDGATTNEDTPVNTGDVTLNDIDPVGGGLTVVAFTQPAIGAVVQNGNAFTFTPPANGDDDTSFTYTARDTIGQETTGTVTITVNPVNDPPSATGQTVSATEDTPKAITLSGSDVETTAANLTYAVMSQPSHGTLSGSGRNYTYTPTADYNGSDSFTFRVTDRGDPDGSGSGALTSGTATVNINVAAVNDPPVLVNDSATVWNGVPHTMSVLDNDTDIDGDTLTITSVSQPPSGTVSHNGTTITYTAPTSGTFSFILVYTATDGTVSGTAVITINVRANTAPSVVVVSPIDLEQNSQFPLSLVAALDASASFDSDDGPEPLSYQWVQTGGPGNPIPISNSNQATANAFLGVVLAPRTYQFEVTVNDGITARAGNVTVRVYAQGTDPGPCTPPSCWPGTGVGSPPAPAALVSRAQAPGDVGERRDDRAQITAVRPPSARTRPVDLAVNSLTAQTELQPRKQRTELRAIRRRPAAEAASDDARDLVMADWRER